METPAPAASLRHAQGPRRLAVTLIAAAALVAGCAGGAATTPAATATPAGSGETACTAAPAPPDQQEGWSSASAPSIYPVIVNSGGSLTCGQNRLLVTFLDANNQPVASPDRSASIALYDLGRDGNTPTQTVDATFVWGIKDVRGYYVANVEFPEAGTWGAEFTTAVGSAAPEKIRMEFDVATTTPVVRVGDPAPASTNPTSADVNGDLAMISSDANPDPAFYKVTVKQALAAHDPFVVVFATPKFCVSGQCGPTLDVVKPLATEHPTVDFINIEPYVLQYQDGSLQPVLDESGGQPALTPVQATLDWGLLSEPWIFVVNREGVVTASFEGVVGTDELEAAVKAVE